MTLLIKKIKTMKKIRKIKKMKKIQGSKVAHLASFCLLLVKSRIKRSRVKMTTLQASLQMVQLDLHLCKVLFCTMYPAGVSISHFAASQEATKNQFFSSSPTENQVFQYHQLKNQYFTSRQQFINQTCTPLRNHKCYKMQ